MKKYLIIIGIIVVILLLSVGGYFLLNRNSATSSNKNLTKYEISDNTNYQDINYKVTNIVYNKDKTLLLTVVITNNSKKNYSYNIEDWKLYDAASEKDLDATNGGKNKTSGKIASGENVVLEMLFNTDNDGKKKIIKYFKDNKAVFGIKLN